MQSWKHYEGTDIMKKSQNINRKQILVGLVLLLFSVMIGVIVYKAQIEEKLQQSISCTLMSAHKENAEITLSADMNEVCEVFECKVPVLREISVECKGKNISSDAILVMALTDADTGDEYYYKEKKISKIGSDKRIIKMKLSSPVKDSEGKLFILSWSIIDAGETSLQLTNNYKPGIVMSFNGDSNNHTNFIYGLRYLNCGNLKILYVALCILLCIFVIVCYWLIAVKCWSVERFYVPVALLLGFIIQFVITVYGVPDEPWHMDTAYKYSNMLLFIPDTGEEGKIYKRRCDVEMGDMLANDLESNSYYQLLERTLEKDENKELIAVSYVDTTNLVPGVFFLPAAVGISIGRILYMPAMLTFQLGRICNLIIFVLLVWYAVRIIPFGKNLFGMLGLLPIAIQQAASASYDAMINGIIFLFVAMCFKMEDRQSWNKRNLLILCLLAVMIVSVKGGVYFPVLFLLCMPFKRKNKGQTNKKVFYQRMILLAGGGIAIFSALLIKYMPTVKWILMSLTKTGEGEDYYTLQYVLKHPLEVICLFWNTLMEIGDTHFRGMLGGMLSWHNVKVNWIFIIMLLIGLLLLSHVEGDRYYGGKKQKILLISAGMFSVLLIMASMMFACTTLNATHILGLQGRYYLALAPLAFLTVTTSMVHVKKEQCTNIWLTLMLTEMFIILEVIATVM